MDGGLQTSKRTFIAAFPLSCPDPVLAGNWIRFFAHHDLSGLNRLSSRFGDSDEAVAFLKDILSDPESADIILAEYGFGNHARWKEFLFPGQEAYLHLSRKIMDKAYWWYYFGTWSVREGRGIHPEIVLVDFQDPAIFERPGAITLNGRPLAVREVMHVEPTGVRTILVSSLSPAPAPIEERIAIVATGLPYAYILDVPTFESMACRLLFRSPLDTGHFTPLDTHHKHGGVWRIE